MSLGELIKAAIAQTTPLEIGANVVNLLSIALATRNSIHTWWVGLVGCVLFGWLFWLGQLYADVTLQLFFVATGILGWWQWLHANGRRLDRPISRMDLRQMFWMVPLGAITALGYGLLLHRFTDAYAPFADSAVLVLSVIAQLLLMQRKLETWVFWLLVNSVAVPLYASRGLWLTAFFYALFWGNALLGFANWRRELRRSPALPKPTS